MHQYDLLFVYGTLRRGCDTAQAARLHDEGAWRGTGKVRGRLYRLGWYPALVEDVAQGGWVTGDVFRMTEPEITLAWLDAYEECGPAFPQPQEYRREVISVWLACAEVRAWAYLYNRAIDGLECIAAGDWLRCRP